MPKLKKNKMDQDQATRQALYDFRIELGENSLRTENIRNEIDARLLALEAAAVDPPGETLEAINNRITTIREELLQIIETRCEEIALRIVELDVDAIDFELDRKVMNGKERKELVQELIAGLKEVIDPELYDLRNDLQRMTNERSADIDRRLTALEKLDRESMNHTVRDTLKKHLDEGKTINLGKAHDPRYGHR